MQLRLHLVVPLFVFNEGFYVRSVLVRDDVPVHCLYFADFTDFRRQSHVLMQEVLLRLSTRRISEKIYPVRFFRISIISLVVRGIVFANLSYFEFVLESLLVL